MYISFLKSEFLAIKKKPSKYILLGKKIKTCTRA